jgi:small subunit ribosomal protein S6
VLERKRQYELMFIISPMYSDEENIETVINRVQQAIEGQGGEVTSVNHSAPWGRRKLAYPIRAYAGGESSRRIFTEGFYVLMHLTLASTKVVEVERALKLTDPVLRHLITIVEQKSRLSGRKNAFAASSAADDAEDAGEENALLAEGEDEEGEEGEEGEEAAEDEGELIKEDSE